MQEIDYRKARRLPQNLFQNQQIANQEAINLKILQPSPFSASRKHKYVEYQTIEELVSSQKKQFHLLPNIHIAQKPSQIYKGSSKSLSQPKNNQNKAIKNVKQVNIDDQIGEVAEWGEKNTKKIEDDFDDQNQYVEQTEEQKAIKKNIEQKLKNMALGQQKKATGGLKAKAEQLKKMNEMQLSQLTKSNQKQNHSLATDQSSKQLIKKQNLRFQQQNSVQNKTKFLSKINEKKGYLQEDPWQQVNKNTLTSYQNKKKKSLSMEAVLQYYKSYPYNPQTIQIPTVKISCLERIFPCFFATSSAGQQEHRLMAIAEKQLSNSDEEYYLLESIWRCLSTKPFLRYGQHWVQVGFQGRDPATDLRSTGVLSLLQWAIFLTQHPKFTKTVNQWMDRAEFPYALTHIKTTRCFLDLVTKGRVRGNWEHLQTTYSSLACAILRKLMDKYEIGDVIGTILEDIVAEISQNHGKYLREYQQYKE